MSESNYDQDLVKPLISQNDEETDICDWSLASCSNLNRMVYEYNKPHNKTKDIILKGFPDKFVYNNSGLVSVLLIILCFIPFINIISTVLLALFLYNVKKKYLEIRKIVKKPWKNMLVVSDIPITFSFATFTSKNLGHLYDKTSFFVTITELDLLHKKVEKELLERPIITVCSSSAISTYKELGDANAIIILVTILALFIDGITFTVLYIIFGVYS